MSLIVFLGTLSYTAPILSLDVRRAKTDVQQVADVVMGNHCDLWDLIDWTDEILGHTVDIQGTAVAFLTTPEKRRVLKAVIELMAGFQRGENLHREAHGIDIAPRQRQLACFIPTSGKACITDDASQFRMETISAIIPSSPTSHPLPSPDIRALLLL